MFEIMANPISKFQYADPNDLMNPYAYGVRETYCGYYTVCYALPSRPSFAPVPADSITLSSAGVSLSVMDRRKCIDIVSYPAVDVSFSQDVTSLGVNDYGAQEWRWYFDPDHPDSFICFQLVVHGDPSDVDMVNQCFVIDVCPASPYIPAGAMTCTFSTGQVSSSVDVSIEATWV